MVSFAVLAVVVMRFGKVGCRAQRRCARSLLPQPTFGTRPQLADVAVVAPGQPPVLQVVHRAITRFLLDQADLTAEQADGGAVTLIQPNLWMKGSAANLNIYLHRLVLDGVYRRTDGEPVFVEVPAPTDEVLQALLHKIIGRLDVVADPPRRARRRGGVDLPGRR